MMQWKKLLSRVVQRGKLDTVAIVDLDGNVLAATPDWKMSPEEFRMFLQLTETSFPKMVRLKFCNHEFTCLRYDDQGTVVGRGEAQVLVARRSARCLLLGLKDAHSSGSALYELTEFGKTLAKKGY